MSKTLLNVKTDTDVKEEAKRISKELGIPLSTIFNAYLKEFIRDREVRFSLEPQLRPKVGQVIKQARIIRKRKML